MHSSSSAKLVSISLSSPARSQLCAVFSSVFSAALQDKESLRNLIKEQHHHAVTAEISRELNHGRNRGDKASASAILSLQTKLPSHSVEDPFKMAHVIMEECD